MELPSPTTPEEQGAYWAIRLVDGPLSRKEALQLQLWLDARPENETLLNEFRLLHTKAKTKVPAMLRSGRAELPSRSRASVAYWRWSGGLAAAAALIFAVLWVRARPVAVDTLAAQRQSLVLDDGSHVDLNARTSLAVRLRGAERRIRLTSGEAFFEVAKDGRPFLVETPTGTIRVTGTKFNVRADHPASLEVTVLEGSVQVAPPTGETVSLGSNDQFAFDGAAGAVQTLDAASAAESIAWRDGFVVFDGAPIRVALERFAHYHGREIAVSPQVETLRLGGKFKLDDFDGFLRDVELTFRVKVLRDNATGSVRVVPR